MNLSQTKIKICGIQCPETAFGAVKLGVNYIGLVFHPQSKRYVNIRAAKNIVKTTKNAGATAVAVFVDHDLKDMEKICHELDVDTVQLHGEISKKQHIKLPKNIKKIYVLNIDNKGELIKALDESFESLCPERDLLLFDGPCGGSGKLIITAKLNDIAGDFKFMVAGGLNQHNIQQTILDCKPFAVDVSSGVESAQGNKDLLMIDRFVKRVKQGALDNDNTNTN